MTQTNDYTDVVARACAFLSSGNPEAARETLETELKSGSEDPLVAAWLARVIGQMESPAEGVGRIQEILVANPDRSDIWVIHMQMLLDAGFPELAWEAGEEIHRRFPDQTGWGPPAVDALELMGNPVGAEDLLARLLQERPDSPALLERKARLRPAASPVRIAGASLREAHEELAASPRLPIGEEFLAEFLRRFAGREGVHALQCRCKSGWGYRPIRKSLDKDLLKRHLAGDQTLGTYLVKRDNSTSLMVFDLDVEGRLATRFEKDPLERRRLLLLLEEEARRLLGNAAEIGLPLLPEFSGFKGFHLWAFSADPVAARHWRALGTWLLSRMPSPPPGLHWELFPKQDSVDAEGLGNLVKIPLGVHKRSGRRSWFVHPVTLKPVPEQEGVFLGHPAMGSEEFKELLGRLTLAEASVWAGERSAAGPSPDNPPRETTAEGSEAQGISKEGDEPLPPLELAVKIPLPKRFPPGIENLLSGCHVLWEIAQTAMSGRSPTGPERHVLVYVLAALGEEGHVCLHQILNQAPGYSPDQVNREIRAVPPQPMSCSKVRRNLPGLAVPDRCSCAFRLPEGAYPSPAVFAGLIPTGGTIAPQRPDRLPPALGPGEEILGTSAGIDRVFREYSEVRATLDRLLAREKVLRSHIDRLFGEAGTDVIRTELGEYRRIPPVESSPSLTAPNRQAETDTLGTPPVPSSVDSVGNSLGPHREKEE